MSRLSTFPRRPPSEQLCDLHVYKVPLELWRAPLNNILNQSVTETVSLGIIRVPIDLPLLDIRAEIDKQLEEQAPRDYVFLRSVGRSITRVTSRQEYEWTAKHFMPPKHYAPELYLLEATPELRDALAISESSSQLSPVSPPRGSPGPRNNRDGYRYGYRQGYGDEPRSHQRSSPVKTTPLHHYSSLPRIKPTTPTQSIPGSPEEAFLTEVHKHRTRDPDADGIQHRYHSRDRLDYRSETREGEELYGSRSHRRHKQTSPKKEGVDSEPPRRHPISQLHDGGHSTDPSLASLDHGSSRSPSPQRKAAGGKSYQGNNGYDREAAYTNDTNEDSGVAGMSPDNQYKHRNRDSYDQAADRSRDSRRYRREEEDEEEKRRQEERDRWAREEEDQRRKEEQEEQERQRKREEEEEERQREEARRRMAEEKGEEERRRRAEEDRRREEENRRREKEQRRQEEEEKEKRRREEERIREEEERRRREREKEMERMRREEEERLKRVSDEDDNRYTSPPHSPSADMDGQRNTESALQKRKEEESKLLEELQEARDSRLNAEKSREDLVKKAKTLQSKTQNRRNQARDVWKKRYFEEKKKTPPLEDQTDRLRKELDALHRKMMAALDGPREKNLKTDDNRPSQKNNYIIQCTRLQHEIDDLKRRVENAKMKLTAEMKLRNQAVGEARTLREELTRDKIKLTQARSQQFAALSPWYDSTPVPSITNNKGEPESATSSRNE